MFVDLEARRLKRYRFWEVCLHENQYFLGRTYVWLLREGKVDLLDLRPGECSELRDILLKLRHALFEAFGHNVHGPDHLLNYAWLCNHPSHGHHGHLHVIPRYRGAAKFNHTLFLDTLWGENYAGYPKDHYVTPQTVLKIAEALRGALV